MHKRVRTKAPDRCLPQVHVLVNSPPPLHTHVPLVGTRLSDRFKRKRHLNMPDPKLPDKWLPLVHVLANSPAPPTPTCPSGWLARSPEICLQSRSPDPRGRPLLYWGSSHQQPCIAPNMDYVCQKKSLTGPAGDTALRQVTFTHLVANMPERKLAARSKQTIHLWLSGPAPRTQTTPAGWDKRLSDKFQTHRRV